MSNISVNKERAARSDLVATKKVANIEPKRRAAKAKTKGTRPQPGQPVTIERTRLNTGIRIKASDQNLPLVIDGSDAEPPTRDDFDHAIRDPEALQRLLLEHQTARHYYNPALEQFDRWMHQDLEKIRSRSIERLDKGHYKIAIVGGGVQNLIALNSFLESIPADRRQEVASQIVIIDNQSALGGNFRQAFYMNTGVRFGGRHPTKQDDNLNYIPGLPLQTAHTAGYLGSTVGNLVYSNDFARTIALNYHHLIRKWGIGVLTDTSCHQFTVSADGHTELALEDLRKDEPNSVTSSMETVLAAPGAGELRLDRMNLKKSEETQLRESLRRSAECDGFPTRGAIDARDLQKKIHEAIYVKRDLRPLKKWLQNHRIAICGGQHGLLVAMENLLLGVRYPGMEEGLPSAKDFVLITGARDPLAVGPGGLAGSWRPTNDAEQGAASWATNNFELRYLRFGVPTEDNLEVYIRALPQERIIKDYMKSFAEDDSGLTIGTSDKSVPADVVVLATGYSSSLGRDVRAEVGSVDVQAVQSDFAPEQGEWFASAWMDSYERDVAQSHEVAPAPDRKSNLLSFGASQTEAPIEDLIRKHEVFSPASMAVNNPVAVRAGEVAAQRHMDRIRGD